ncbi:hypothetical protein T05_3619 [Trichinella murrelli]|uniref:Uncharacterized protein n=1 Tax=Trichinella murrelli TaxID=144512 RepID=A0A0V0T2K5_9BILA|nr:hypothetical protein T05_3619 [Trichinella murrelli]
MEDFMHISTRIETTFFNLFEMDRKWKKIDLPKTTKYCINIANFNEYRIIMLKIFPIPKFNHRRSVSTDFQMGHFPVY